jgi:dipeptidyl aminopeptidase/acylaminoacyl peptidase
MPSKTSRSKPKRRRPFNFSDLMSVDRISDPKVSPDGRYVAYVVTRAVLKENKMDSSIWLLDLKGGSTRDLTPGPGTHNDPAWSPDGGHIAFASDRGEDGRQLWVMPSDGGEARRLTEGKGGAGAPIWSPDGTRIAFARSVVVSPHLRGRVDDPSHQEVYGLPNEQSKARIETSLLFRHWDHWRELRRSHVFVVDVATGKLADITPGDSDVPPISLGGAQDFVWAPKGDEVAYIKIPDRVVARSVNNSVFLQTVDGIRRRGRARKVSDTRACDSDPVYSLDGRHIAYLGCARPGYEADRRRVKLYDRRTGRTRSLTEDLDRSAASLAFTSDGKHIVFQAQDRGRISIYRVPLAGGPVVQLTEGTTNSLMAVVPGSRDLIVGRETTTSPVELHRLTPGKGVPPFTDPGPVPKGTQKDAGARTERLTHHNDVLGKGIDWHDIQEFWYKGADGDPVHGWMAKPPGFDSKRRWPVALIIHGGPQSAFLDHFNYRWSLQMFAAQGMVAVQLNPRGSSGYGDTFQDQISLDWGGRCYQDIMLGVDHVLGRYKYLDPDRMVAAGASFGGFMANWIEGHSDRFRALVSHDGIFNAETMAYSTEELWFEEWEHGGLPHTNREATTKFSPHLHVANFRTPMLVIQGEQDMRCPMSEGLSLFTALQTMGVESKFLYFPDEGHWVLKPANSQVWYENVLGWLKDHA